MVITPAEADAGQLDLSEVIEPDAERIGPIHPGMVLRQEFLEPLGIEASTLALELKVPAGRIEAILAGRKGVTADTALRLARYLGGNAGWWLRLQARYDEELARRELGSIIEREEQPPAN